MLCYNLLGREGAAADIKRVRSFMADVESAQPKDDIFGNVCGVVRDALHVSRGQHVLDMGGNQRSVLLHGGEQILEDVVAEVINRLLAFEDFAGEGEIAINQRAEATANHGA